MKTNIIKAVTLFFCMSLYGQINELNDLYGLPFFQEADATYEFDKKNIVNYSLFFVPKLYLDGTGSFSGDFEDGFSVFSATPSISVVQNLPGNFKLECSVESNMNYVEENDFSYSLNPGVMLSVPLISTPSYLKIYHNYEKNNYALRKRNTNIKYQIAIREGICKFVSETGNYVYYKKLMQLFDEKMNLLEQQTEDYERLFELGRITAVTLSDQIAQKMKFFQEKVDVESKYIGAKKKLMELGVEENNLTDDMRKFIVNWNDYCNLYHGETFFRDEQQLIATEISHFNFIESANSSVPVFSAGFAVKTPDGLQDFPDFSEAAWQIKFAFSIPVTEKFGLNTIETIQKNHVVTSLEKAKYIRSQKSSAEEREGYIKLYRLYKDSMRSTSDLEKNRLNSYRELYSAGKLSNFDLRMQENTSLLAEAYADYADLQFLVTKLSFY